jgi:predicted ATPase
MVPGMIKKIVFRNFKVLAAAELPLERFTLLVGPNGSGKSTVFQALQFLAQGGNRLPDEIWSVQSAPAGSVVELAVHWGDEYEGMVTTHAWAQGVGTYPSYNAPGDYNVALLTKLGQLQVFALEADAIRVPWHLQHDATLQPDGGRLALVLDRMRDQHPERFEELNQLVPRWFPEFDRILFETSVQGQRSLLLRTREGKHAIKAEHLSQGTLLGLALFTLAYLPDPPAIIGLEEPDRGLHPRLLRDVRDAIYRLCYPEAFGENRSPVQVIATTHSPYFLDLYKDHPEEIVIAQKEGGQAYFKRLVDIPDFKEILESTSLGEVWYSGILGGVPAN